MIKSIRVVLSILVLICSGMWISPIIVLLLRGRIPICIVEVIALVILIIFVLLLISSISFLMLLPSLLILLFVLFFNYFMLLYNMLTSIDNSNSYTSAIVIAILSMRWSILWINYWILGIR